MILIRNVKIRVLEDREDLWKKKITKLLKIKNKDIKELKIKRKSLDARDKQDIYFVYEFLVTLEAEEKVLKARASSNILKYEYPDLQILKGQEKLKGPIIVVGSGPAGLFATYLLAKYGYKPLLIERGMKVEERVVEVNKFFEKGLLNPECNVQFGEGGAGTFSDGKLNTLVKDKEHLGEFVLKTFVEFKAPEEILYLKNPHIGTDILRDVIKNMRDEIIRLGGTIRYNTKLTSLKIACNSLKAIEVNDNELISCENLILAIGHSARDTIEMLYAKGLNIINKPFAVGVRVQHKQDLINESQYGKFKDVLPNANYKLTYTTKKRRGVYSFCMCPGGYVINASSEKGRLAINGMSNYKRDTENANSAIVVTVDADDFGNTPLAGLAFQRDLEEKAYQLGQGKIPLQLFKDFQNNQKTEKLASVDPVLKGSYTLTNLRLILPDFISEAILEAMPHFSEKIKGFANQDTILAAIESRTSSPVRMVRDEKMEANIKGIYPVGEGAGYSGGITTSAIDGLKVALELMKKYQALTK